MKIAFYEMTHFETAATMLRLFLHQQHELLVCTNAACQKKLSEHFAANSALRWLVQEPSESNRDFISRMGKTWQQWQPDLVWYNTLSFQFHLHAKWLNRLQPCKTVLVVHAVNALFDEPLTGLRALVRRSGWKKLLPRIDAFGVFTIEMQKALQQRKGDTGQPVLLVPGADFLEGQPNQQPAPLTIIVPGSIDAERRDYQQVEQLMLQLDKRKVFCRLIIAGQAVGGTGMRIVQRLKNYTGKSVQVQVMEGDLSEAQFRAVLAAAHFIWSPAVQQSSAYYGITEQYGQTKSSGNLFDAIRSARPFIGPAFLPTAALLGESAFSYTRPEDLVLFLEELTNDFSRYAYWAKAAMENSQRHRTETLSARFVSDWTYMLSPTGKTKNWVLTNGKMPAFRHGGIGYLDAELSLRNQHYRPLLLPDAPSLANRLRRWFLVRRWLSEADHSDKLVVLFPLYPRMYRYLARAAAAKGIKVQVVLMDIDGLKDGDAALLEQELQLLSHFDQFVVHGPYMAKWLLSHFPKARYSELGPFDYYANRFEGHRTPEPVVCFAGNLEKSPFTQHLTAITGVRFLLYGLGGEKLATKDNLVWKGVFNPVELPAMLEGSFGLVWDGDEISRAAGVFGDYMPYIFHHKVSLYILAGLPMLVYSRAGSAGYIQSHRLGWLVDDLHDLPGLLQRITADEYREVVENLRKEAVKLGEHRQLLSALSQLSS